MAVLNALNILIASGAAASDSVIDFGLMEYVRLLL